MTCTVPPPRHEPLTIIDVRTVAMQQNLPAVSQRTVVAVVGTIRDVGGSRGRGVKRGASTLPPVATTPGVCRATDRSRFARTGPWSPACARQQSPTAATSLCMAPRRSRCLDFPSCPLSAQHPSGHSLAPMILAHRAPRQSTCSVFTVPPAIAGSKPSWLLGL